MISIVMYILTMLYVLYTYYNRANDLMIEVSLAKIDNNKQLQSTNDFFLCRACASLRLFTMCRGWSVEWVFGELF